MKRLAPFLVFPALGLALLLAAFLWGGRDLRTRLLGESVPARLPGMWITRADGPSDLLTGIRTQLRLATADGRAYHIEALNHRPVSARALAPDGSELATWDAPRLDLDHDADDSGLPANLKPFLRRTIAGDISLLRGALRGEARRPDDPARIVRAEKIETIHGYLDLPAAPPALLAQPGDALYPVAPAKPAPRGELRIRAVLDLSDSAALAARRGDSLVAYEYLRDGVAQTPAKKNFYLHAEPSSTEFRPVYAYEADGRAHVRLSHIGRLGGPTLALRLFNGSKVYYNPAQPELGVLIAAAGSPDGQYLAWFSRLCEGVFSQWSTTAILACAGIVMLVVGLLALSLLIKPPHHPASG